LKSAILVTTSDVSVVVGSTAVWWRWPGRQEG